MKQSNNEEHQAWDHFNMFVSNASSAIFKSNSFENMFAYDFTLYGIFMGPNS